MEIDLEVEVKGCLVSSNPDAMDPYFVLVKVLFEEVEIDRYTLNINDKEEEFPDLFSRILLHNRLIDFEKRFIGRCSIDGSIQEFSTPTKMKDIDSSVSEYIYSFN